MSSLWTIDIINIDASLGVAVGWSRMYGSGGGSAQEVRNPRDLRSLLLLLISCRMYAEALMLPSTGRLPTRMILFQ